jgi:hypothetical protein
LICYVSLSDPTGHANTQNRPTTLVKPAIIITPPSVEKQKNLNLTPESSKSSKTPEKDIQSPTVTSPLSDQVSPPSQQKVKTI